MFNSPVGSNARPVPGEPEGTGAFIVDGSPVVLALTEILRSFLLMSYT
jgi:hypothetical protein